MFHRSSAQPNYATTANYQILEFFKLPFSRQRVCIFSWKCLMFQCLYLLASYTRCFDIQRVWSSWSEAKLEFIKPTLLPSSLHDIMTCIDRTDGSCTDILEILLIVIAVKLAWITLHLRCVRFDENQAGPFARRFYLYVGHDRVSSSITSQFVYQKITIPKIVLKNILKKEICFIFHNIMIIVLFFLQYYVCGILLVKHPLDSY